MRRWTVAALTLLFALSAGTLLLGKGPVDKKGPGGPGSGQKGKSTSVGVVISTSGKRPTGPTSRPPGWNEGKKTGWRGGAEPPGLAKKSGTSSVVVHAGATTRTSGAKSGRSAGVSAAGTMKKPAKDSAHSGPGGRKPQPTKER